MSITKVIVTSLDSAAMILDQLDPQGNADSNNSLQRLARWIDGLADGAFYYSSVIEDVGAAQATGTLTVTSTGPTNGQTATVANITLTAVTSGADPTAGQFNISATPATVASGIAAAINQTAAFAHVVTATSNGGVVTITAVEAGPMGNGVELSAGNLSNTAAAGFSGGSNGTSVILS